MLFIKADERTLTTRSQLTTRTSDSKYSHLYFPFPFFLPPAPESSAPVLKLQKRTMRARSTGSEQPVATKD
jgi:hypothetical protein